MSKISHSSPATHNGDFFMNHADENYDPNSPIPEKQIASNDSRGRSPDRQRDDRNDQYSYQNHQLHHQIRSRHDKAYGKSGMVTSDDHQDDDHDDDADSDKIHNPASSHPAAGKDRTYHDRMPPRPRR